MPRSLPLRASLDWLRKLARDRQKARRSEKPDATLSDSQLEVAREYGFASWRQLKAHVDQQRERLDALVSPDLLRAAAHDRVGPDDPDLMQLLADVDAGASQAVADRLARRPALANAKGPDGRAPIHVAAQRNDPRLAALLVAYGADPEARYGDSGHTAVSWAVTCQAFECARALVRLGAQADLFTAAGLGDLESVRACFDGSGNLIEGASTTGSSRFGPDGSRLPCPPETPRERISDALAFACRNGQVEVVEFLLDRQPDLSFRAYLGATPLHWAHFGGSREAIRRLEEAGADPSSRDDTLGCTPRGFGILVPAQWGLEFLVRARLDEDPSLANFIDGRTSALHEAARSGHPGVVRLLLGRGAARSMVDGAGKAPVDLAFEGGHADVVALLERQAAD
ncbi:MAG: ankyrin repeat domain-containing protein [Isosphaeraceae bacterium]